MIYICPEYRRNTQWTLLQQLWLLHVISHTWKCFFRWKCSTTIGKKDKVAYTRSRTYSSIIYRHFKKYPISKFTIKMVCGLWLPPWQYKSNDHWISSFKFIWRWISKKYKKTNYYDKRYLQIYWLGLGGVKCKLKSSSSMQFQICNTTTPSKLLFYYVNLFKHYLNGMNKSKIKNKKQKRNILSILKTLSLRLNFFHSYTHMWCVYILWIQFIKLYSSSASLLIN